MSEQNIERVSLLGLPLVLTAMVPDWFYSQPGFIDAWVYHGFFRHLEVYATTMFPLTYYGARLAWIVPGYVVYHVLHGTVAAFALHVTMYCAAVWSMYGIVHRVASANALFAAVAFGLYLPIVSSLGSDYVDAGVIAYGLLSVFLALKGIESSKGWLLIGAGFFAGAMLHSNIGSVFLLPSIAVWVLPERRDGAVKTCLIRMCLWGLGIVVCTIALAAVSAAIGARWDFFEISFGWMRSQRGINVYDVPGVSWFPETPWVFLPIATVIPTIIAVSIPRRRCELTNGHIKALLSLASCVAMFLAWDYLGPGALLYYPYYGSWLVPWCFIVIAVMLASTASSKRDHALLVLVAGALLLSHRWPERLLPFAASWLGLLLLTGVVGFALLNLAVSGRLAMTVALISLHGWLLGTPSYSRSQGKADAFHVIDQSLSLIEPYVNAEPPRFLITSGAAQMNSVQGLVSVYLWDYSIASTSFPEVAPERASRIVHGTTVVVVADEPITAPAFDQVFAPYGFSGHLLKSVVIATRAGPLYLTVLRAMAV